MERRRGGLLKPPRRRLPRCALSSSDGRGRVSRALDMATSRFDSTSDRLADLVGYDKDGSLILLADVRRDDGGPSRWRTIFADTNHVPFLMDISTRSILVRNLDRIPELREGSDDAAGPVLAEPSDASC